MKDQDKLLTADEVAERTRFHKLTVYRFAREGRLPHIRLGVNVRFRESAIRRWIRDNEQREQAKQDE